MAPAIRFLPEQRNVTVCGREFVRVNTVTDFNDFINNYIKQFIKIHALSV